MGPPIPPRSFSPPQIKRPVRRTGMNAVSFHMERIQRNITDRPGRSLSVALAVAVGVSIAIAIIAASNGIHDKVDTLLNPGQTVSNQAALQNAGIQIGTVNDVLIQTRDLLKALAIGFTAALVGLITLLTMGQRRREISIAVMQGEHRSNVVIELLGEALILCIIGGFTGIALGYLLCSLLQQQLTLLPLDPSPEVILPIFPWTTLLSFSATAVIAVIFAGRRDTSVTY